MVVLSSMVKSWILRFVSFSQFRRPKLLKLMIQRKPYYFDIDGKLDYDAQTRYKIDNCNYYGFYLFLQQVKNKNCVNI